MDWIGYVINVIQMLVGVAIGAYIGTKIGIWEMKRSVIKCLENKKCVERWLKLLEVLKETEMYKRLEKILKDIEELLE
jgi:hypothetical protein